MTNYAELIAEAEMLAKDQRDMGLAHHASATDRLAAALRECAPPEGWRVTEYANRAGDTVNEHRWNEWMLHFADGTLHRKKNECVSYFPTASAAMAALDGKS